jgi:hypothetical protein
VVVVVVVMMMMMMMSQPREALICLSFFLSNP